MTIDERLEAITQSLELVAGMQRANEERYERRFQAIAHNFEIVLDSIKRLENIASAHEQRLDDLENR